jgi:hypothetical protein
MRQKEMGGTALLGTAVCWRTTWGGVLLDVSAAGGAKYRLKVFLEEIEWHVEQEGAGEGAVIMEHDRDELLRWGNANRDCRIVSPHTCKGTFMSGFRDFEQENNYQGHFTRHMDGRSRSHCLGIWDIWMEDLVVTALGYETNGWKIS